MSDTTLAFIGAGNIARAIIGGIIQGSDDTRIIAVDPSAEQLAQLPGSVKGFETATGHLDAADAVVLCVKPNLIAPVIESLRDDVKGKLLISVAAGVTVDTMLAALGEDAPVVRCMPNTPSLVGTGMSGLYANASVSAAQKSLAENVMKAAGEVHWVAVESELHGVTAVSGSGPAYFFYVMEAMEAAGVELGLDAETSRRLVLQTALGAAKMAALSTDDPATLRRNVSSPGGTTEAAIKSLGNSGLPESFSKAMAACYQRSIELGEEN